MQTNKSAGVKAMPVKTDREYRSADKFNASENYIVEGYASTFDPYVLFSDGDIDYSERIDAHAFDEADMSDVIMQYDHEGRVYARQSNGTLKVFADDHGLKIRADLSKTEGSRRLYDDIKAGMITQMSFAFTVEDDHYEKETRTRVVDRVKRVYDVSAVSIPANPGTEISARNYFDGVIEAERAERLEAEEYVRKCKILRLMLEVNA